MSERLPDSIEVIRADKFVETDANAFVVLSKEESDRIVEKARLAKEARKAKATGIQADADGAGSIPG